MKYYVIKNKNELQVISVSSDQENAFKAAYGDQVIVCGDSIKDALVKLDGLPVIITKFVPH